MVTARAATRVGIQDLHGDPHLGKLAQAPSNGNMKRMLQVRSQTIGIGDGGHDSVVAVCAVRNAAITAFRPRLNLARERARGRTWLRGRHVSRALFSRTARGLGLSTAVLLDDHGRLLQTLPADPSLLGVVLSRRNAHLAAAAAGNAGVSNVVSSAARRDPVVASATSSSRRRTWHCMPVRQPRGTAYTRHYPAQLPATTVPNLMIGPTAQEAPRSVPRPVAPHRPLKSASRGQRRSDRMYGSQNAGCRSTRGTACQRQSGSPPCRAIAADHRRDYDLVVRDRCKSSATSRREPTSSSSSAMAITRAAWT
jgi:hypothetical protein